MLGIPFKRLMVLGTGFLLASCDTSHYVPPAYVTFKGQHSFGDEPGTLIDRLVENLESTSFFIEEIDRESGKVVISFGGGRISKWVDCGRWVASQYTQIFADRIQTENGAVLNATATVLLEPISETATNVSIRASYNLEVPARLVRHGISGREVWARPASRWEFSSNTTSSQAWYNTKNLRSTVRTCRSTKQAEDEILEAMIAG